MSASAAFGAQLDALGIWWPRGDGDALRDNATGWNQVADLIEDVAAVLDAAASSVTENYRGEAATRFAALWAQWSGPAGYLATTAPDCRRIAAAAADFGTDIDIADRTLLRLIEQALAVLDPATGTPAPEQVRWLHECSSILGQDLAARAQHRCTGLEPIAGVDAHVPGEIDPSTIDPTQITWPGLGTPVDLGHVATTPVDFGAGQGTLPSDVPGPAVPGPGTPAPGPGLGGGTRIEIELPDGTTIEIETPGGGLGVDPAEPVLEPPLRIGPEPPLDDPLGGGGGTGLGGGGGGFGGGGLGDLGDLGAGFEPTDFSAGLPPLPATPPLDASPLDLGPVPVNVDPPVSTPTAAAGAAGAATAALGLRGGGSGGGGRAPFFPFMPMAGGMSGDEGEEPKRRRRR